MNKIIIILIALFLGIDAQAQLRSSSNSLNVGEFGNGIQTIKIPVINQSRSELLVFGSGNNNVLIQFPQKMNPYQVDYITLQPSGLTGKNFSQVLNFTVDGESVSVKISGKFKKVSDQDCADFSENNVRVKQSRKYVGRTKVTNALRIYSDDDESSLFISDPEKYPFAHFVVLIDASGSMGGYNKLETLKAHLSVIVDEMRPTDYISVLTYSEESEIVVDYQSGKDKDNIKAQIESIEAGGFTNGRKGIESALEFTRGRQRAGLSNRLIMLTDGDFNLGDEHEELMSFLLWQNRSMSYKLSIMTIGSMKENQKEMKSLSKTGNGYYFNLDDGENWKEEMNRMLLKQLST